MVQFNVVNFITIAIIALIATALWNMGVAWKNKG